MIQIPFLSSIKILFLILGFCIIESCSSQYHWVKVKSKDPQKIHKEDSLSLAVLNPMKIQDSIPVLENQHGKVSIQYCNSVQKAFDISKDLGRERRMALQSKFPEIRNQAIRQTLHEQFEKNPAYSQLSYSQQNKIESKITKSITHKAHGLDLSGINNLVIVGVLLLLGSILFFIFPSIAFIGVLIDVVAAVLIILGLVQMLG